jgi:tRNA A37 threonylcarbamoyladenosine biosynthesis protein TsaE
VDDLFDAKSVILIEWGEKFARFERERDAEVVLERTGENRRRIVFTAETRRRGEERKKEKGKRKK